METHDIVIVISLGFSLAAIIISLITIAMTRW
jgi:hypothetical protein